MRLAVLTRIFGTPYARATAVITIVMLASAMGVGLAIWMLRQDAIAAAMLDANNIATVLAEQGSNSVRSIELVIDDLIDDVNRNQFTDASEFQSKMLQQQTHNLLLERLRRLPQADVVTVTDANGDMIATTRSWPSPVLNLSDRDYFQHLSQSPTPRDLFISTPVKNKVFGMWTIFFAKAILGTNGEFQGMIVVGVRPEYFLRALEVVSSIPGQSLLLLRQDGQILLRHPDPILRTGEQMPKSSEWYRVVAEGGGTYRSPGYFDFEPRQVAVRNLNQYPLVVDIAVSEKHALATWRKRATAFGLVTIGIELTFAFLLRTLYLQFKRTSESEILLARRSDELHVSNLRFDAALTHMSHGIAMYDAAGLLVIHNRQYELIWGMSSDELASGTPLEKILKLRVARGLYAGTNLVSYLKRHQLPRDRRYSETQTLSDGRSVLMTFDPMPDGGWVTTHEDVTERQRAEAKIAHMAHHDTLTDLANRGHFINKVHELISAATAEFVVFLVDLDHFKEVNDTFGHGVGDQLLRHVATRLISAVNDMDVVARLGGDEFAILRQIDATGIDGIMTLAEGLLATVRAPYSIEGHDVMIGLSIGITQVAANEAPEQIMSHADLALYRAKADGRNRFRIFEASMEEQVQTRRQLALDLQLAIAEDGLQVFYQPIVDAQTLEYRTMEALARWQHPKRGMVPPNEFIALAEEAGLIHRLGEWVMRRACEDALAWPEHVRVAVNVSAIQVAQSTLPSIVSRVLTETGLPPRRLKLEITESVLLSDSGRALATLHALRNLGVAIALDDFGTGYSSLSYLKMFPFDELKIDKSFIDDIAVHRGCAAIVAATTSLARAFDMVTTAEGVETREQFELLRAAAVMQMQGYYFGRPAPASAWDFNRHPLLELTS